MRRFLLVLFALVVLLVLAAILAPNLIPADTYRGRVEQAASERLGRQVTLDGPISLRILPRLEVRAQDVTIANAQGFGEEPFAEMSALRLGLALGPLLNREIAIEEFVLVEPAIRLRSNGAANNWTFGSSEDAAQSQGGGRRAGALPVDARFGDVRLEDASLSYAAPGSDWRVSDLDLDMDLPALDAPMSLSGGFALNGERFTLQAELAGLRQAFEGERTPLSLSLEGAPLTLNLDGAVPEGADWGLAGRADVAMEIRRFARLAGLALPDGEGFERFEAGGDLRLDASRAALQDARIRFDAITATGDLGVNYAGNRPRISGSLNIPELNLNPYIPQSQPTGRGGAGGGWSDERIDLSPIAAIDGVITGRVGTLIANDIRVNDADLRVEFDRGVATASVEQFDLYDGRGFINARVDLRDSTPRFRMQGELDALDALPFLRDAADFEYLRGIGGMRFDLASEGASTAAIMNALNGEARFGFQNGAIAGVNIPAVIRAIERALETRQLPRGFGERQTTDFTELSGTVEIADGLARNLDLTMLSPLLRVQGQGEIDLAGRRIDYRLTPRAVETLAGQGGELDLQGVPIPIRIRGGFNDLSIGLDFDAIARTLVRRQAGDAVGGEAGRVLREGGSLEDAARGALGEAIRDALGGREQREEPAPGDAGSQSEDGESQTADQPAERPRDPGRALLEGLISDALGGGGEEDQGGDSGDPGGG